MSNFIKIFSIIEKYQFSIEDARVIAQTSEEINVKMRVARGQSQSKPEKHVFNVVILTNVFTLEAGGVHKLCTSMKLPGNFMA